MDAPSFVDETETLDDSPLYEHFKFIADKGQSLMRVDKFLTARIENISRNRIQTAAEAGTIWVNGLPAKASYKIKPGDEVSVVTAYPPRDTAIVPQNIPLDIVYEDADLLVVNKAAGMVVHPGHGNYEGTLVHALAYHLKDLPYFCTGDVRAGLVHRIDKNTSGLLVVAKNIETHIHLAKQFFDHSTQRCYVALVWGMPAPQEGTIAGNLARSTRDRLKMQVYADENVGKQAITHYKVAQNLQYVSVVECQLETGRTHQIRAHFEHIGHPLFNDERYGGNQILRGTTFTKYKQFVENCFALVPHHVLHAKTLGFVHPTTKKEMLFDSPLPQNVQALIDKWQGYVG
ncbi:pseudouridine synthase [Bacteroidia bacterium]|nr:pseudouridine synthase [Bacteroidia bacterium]